MALFSGFFNLLRRLFGGDGMGSSGSGGRLYVGNLSYQVKDEELRSMFSKYGKVRTLHLIRDRITRRLKGYAFVEMPPEDAQRAIALNGVDFLGRKLVVSMAKTKKPSGSSQSPQKSSRPQPSQGSSSGPRLEKRPEGGRSEGRPEGRPQGRRPGGPPNRWRKNRSGPRAYGEKGETNTPLPRYE